MSLWLVAKDPTFEVHMGYFSSFTTHRISIERSSQPHFQLYSWSEHFSTYKNGVREATSTSLPMTKQNKASPLLPPSPHSIQLASRQIQFLQSWPVDPESYRTLLGRLCTSLLILPSQPHRLILFLKLFWLQGLHILLDLVLWHRNVVNDTCVGFLLKGVISGPLPKVVCFPSISTYFLTAPHFDFLYTIYFHQTVNKKNVFPFTYSRLDAWGQE